MKQQAANNNHSATKAPEELIYDDVDNYNKVTFAEIAMKELKEEN